MKKIVVFCIVFSCVGLSNLFAQYDLSLLHSASGKKWVQYNHPDDERGAAADRDDSFIFYSDGRVEVDYGVVRKTAKAPNASFSSDGGGASKRSTWTSGVRVLNWTVVNNGSADVYRAEIQVLTADKLVLNLIEPGCSEPRIVILLSK